MSPKFTVQITWG